MRMQRHVTQPYTSLPGSSPVQPKNAGMVALHVELIVAVVFNVCMESSVCTVCI